VLRWPHATRCNTLRAMSMWRQSARATPAQVFAGRNYNKAWLGHLSIFPKLSRPKHSKEICHGTRSAAAHQHQLITKPANKRHAKAKPAAMPAK